MVWFLIDWCSIWFLLGCKVNYHHNFRVHEGQRIYYDEIPDLIQVGEHQFAERKLIDLWILMMLLSWTSAMNCAQIYKMGFSGSKLSIAGNLWSGFMMHLLFFHSLRTLRFSKQHWSFHMGVLPRTTSPELYVHEMSVCISAASQSFCTIATNALASTQVCFLCPFATEY